MSRDQFQIPQNVDFKIFSPNTNRVVHLASDGKIILYDQTNQNTNDAGNMKWQFEVQDDGSYYIYQDGGAYATSPPGGGPLTGSSQVVAYRIDVSAYPFITIRDFATNYWTCHKYGGNLTTTKRSYDDDWTPPQVWQLSPSV